MQEVTTEPDDNRRTDVLVIDRHAMLAESLVVHLSQGGMSARAGLLEPDQERRIAPVLVLDGDLPAQVLQRHLIAARRRCTDVALILLSSPSTRPEGAADGLAVHSWVSRDVGVDAVAAAVARAQRGGRPQRVHRTRLTSTRPATFLTARELDVLRSLARGRTNEQVAEELKISVSTVRTHVGSILMKLEAKSRFDAVYAARRRGFLDVRDSAGTA